MTQTYIQILSDRIRTALTDRAPDTDWFELWHTAAMLQGRERKALQEDMSEWGWCLSTSVQLLCHLMSEDAPVFELATD